MRNKVVVVLAMLLLALAAKADIRIRDVNQRVLIGKDVVVFHPDRELDVRAIMSVAADSFKPTGAEVPNFGLSKTSVWLKFTISNETPVEDLLLDIDFPMLNEAELYYLSDSNTITGSVRLGKILPFPQRSYQHPTYIFDLNIAAHHSGRYLLKVNNTSQLFLPMYVNAPKLQFQNISNENMLCGIYMGIILIMVFYNLFIFISVRDKSYLYYVIYICFVGLTQIGLKGYNYQYLWPYSPHFEEASIIVFASISGIAALLFTAAFLEISSGYKKLNILIWVLVALFLLSIGITLSGQLQNGFSVMQLTTSVTALAIFGISLYIMLKGNKAARFFFLAWVTLLTGSVIFLLKDFGILPYNTFTVYSVQAASVAEISLLSFGLANRINILKKEKEASQLNALRIAEENERIIREQNVHLEFKVNERTLELKGANNELNLTLDNLKQAQSQLVESEKMASLGQLTAGIAHEINNPINFVTSNVTPLKRDVGMLFDAIAAIEEVGMSALTTEEKQARIDEYKEDLDYDYLKVEINHLLKGIHEGASRTAEIVKGLRIFSRVDEDDLKKADINEGIDSTIIIINNLLDNRIEIIRDYGDLPLIECYPGKLNQVFLNIITNAIHAIKQQFGDQPGGQIHIATGFNEKEVIVRIKDNGTGMTENTMRKIFEPFFTTKDVGEGTGLGMSIAYNTIKKHNGQITIESETGKGAEFIIKLPIIFVVPPIA